MKYSVIKSKYLHHKLLYLVRLSFQIEGEIQSFPDKKKIKEFVNTKPILQQILKDLLLEEKVKDKTQRKIV